MSRRPAFGVILSALAASAAAIVLTACGEKPEPAIPTQASTTTTTPETRSLVIYRRSGGVAGIRERLSVSNDGAATLELGEPPDDTTSRFKLTPAELRELHRRLAGADLKSTPSSGCADCFEYEITTMTGTTRFDERAIPPHTQALLTFLGKLLADNIPAHAAGTAGTKGGK